MADRYDGAEIDVLAFGAAQDTGADAVQESPAEEEREPSIEELMAEIDGLCAEMEEGDLSLEDSFARYRRGMELIKQCNRQISAVEKQMQVLDEQGELDDF